MIFQYHLDFKDEKELQTPVQRNIRGIIPVIEDDTLELSDIFSLSSPWDLASGIRMRSFGAEPYSKEHCDVSWGMEVDGVLMLLWSKEKETIYYRKGKAYRPDRLRFWVYHTFLPISLARRGIYHILHVGSVEIAGRPVLFVAPSYGGKSTMTDYFIRRGHTMLSDDSLGIEHSGDTYTAIPSYPFHRPYRKVEDLGYPAENFSREVKAISAIYVLNKSEEAFEIVIREIKGIEKFKVLNSCVFARFYCIEEGHFSFFTQMAKKIPMYEISYPHDLERLPEVYKEIVHWQGKVAL